MSECKKDEDQLKLIIGDIQDGILGCKEIILKYGLTTYKYYKILKEYDIINDASKPGPKRPTGPKQTKFKSMINGSNVSKEIVNEFDLEQFKIDCRSGVKINELMEKYKLSLYQVRELRKNYK